MFVVTGASGFIGSAMVWELNRRGHTSIVLSDFVPLSERRPMYANLKYENFLEPEALLEALKTQMATIDGIFHMGACSSTTEMDTAYLQRVNTDYTRTLWQICCEKKVPFIYASSGAVYGDGEKGFSDSPPSERFQPLNPYGWSKLKFDVFAEAQSSAPPIWYGLRFFNVFGPHEYFKGPMASLVFKATEQIRTAGKLKLFRSYRADYRDGEQMRDFVYVKDVVRWMWELWQLRPSPNGIYNMGYGVPRTWLDLAHAVFAGLGATPNIDWIDMPENIRYQYQYFTKADMDRFSQLGLSKPAWSLEDGIRDYIKNYLYPSTRYLVPS